MKATLLAVSMLVIHSLTMAHAYPRPGTAINITMEAPASAVRDTLLTFASLMSIRGDR